MFKSLYLASLYMLYVYMIKKILGVNRTEGARINKQDLPVGQVTKSDVA